MRDLIAIVLEIDALNHNSVLIRKSLSFSHNLETLMFSCVILLLL